MNYWQAGAACMSCFALGYFIGVQLRAIADALNAA
jgi:hypothetical protein